MRPRRLAAIVMVLLAAWTAQAGAEEGLAASDECILGKFAAGQQPTACIDEAHGTCLKTPSAMPSVASVCFRAAQDRWSAGIKALMEAVRAKASKDVAVLASIEVKYDLLAGLMQCDRMEELSMALSELSQEDVLRQKTHCAATASGLAYARLRWRTRDLD